MKQYDDKSMNSKEMSIPVRAALSIFMFGFAFMLTVGLFFPESPLSPRNLRGASGSTSATGGAPEMLWVVIPALYWGAYSAAKIVLSEIKAKKSRDKN